MMCRLSEALASTYTEEEEEKKKKMLDDWLQIDDMTNSVYIS